MNSIMVMIKNILSRRNCFSYLTSIIFTIKIILFINCNYLESQEEEIRKLIYENIKALNTADPNYANTIHPHNSIWKTPKRIAELLVQCVRIHREVTNIAFIENSSQEIKVQIIIRVTSKTESSISPIEQTEIWTFRKDQAKWKIYEQYTKNITGSTEIDELAFLVRVCHLIDPSISTEQFIERARTRFGEIGRDPLDYKQIKILDAIVCAIAIIYNDDVKSLNLTGEILDQIQINDKTMECSQIAFKKTTYVLLKIFPEIYPYIGILSLNQSYIIPLIYKDKNHYTPPFGYDVCHPENLRITVDNQFKWIKLRFQNIFSCALNDELTIEKFLPKKLILKDNALGKIK